MRRQLPVYSPLSLGAIGAAARSAALAGDREIEGLRRDLTLRFSARDVVLTDSGTHALQVALGGLSSRNGPPVVALPGYSCYDLVTAALGAAVHTRFYDIDPASLAPDADSLRAVLSEGVDAVVVGNLYGYPLNWSELFEICRPAGVPIIEDAAQGVGTSVPEGKGGALGDATVLSFGRGKGWTGGGGGALLLRDARFVVAEQGLCRGSGGGSHAKALAANLATWLLGRPSLYRLPTSVPALGLGETRFKEPTGPRRISSVSAALARETAEAAIRAVPARRELARRLLALVRDAPSSRARIRPSLPLGGPDSASFLRLPVLAIGQETSDDLRTRGPAFGVMGGYPRPLHRLPQTHRVLLRDPPSLPGSEELALRLLTLPTHELMTDADLRGIQGLMAPHNPVKRGG